MALSPLILFLIFVVFFLVLLFIGWPIAFSMGTAAVVAYLFSGGSLWGNFAILTYNAMFNYNLLALPIFVLMGYLLIYGGSTDKLYNGITPLMERLTGGLIYSNIVANVILGACCGSTIAATSAMSTVAIPELSERGYKKSISYGSLASGGCLSALIPPSVGMILFCSITTVSLGSLFIAGIVPGLILAAFFILVSYFWVILDPSVVPPKSEKEKAITEDFFFAFKNLWALILLIAIILGVIYFGFGTPTEAGCFGVVGAIVLSVANRKLTWEMLSKSLLLTCKVSGGLLLIIAMASTYGFALTALGLRDFLLSALEVLPGPPVIQMHIIFLFLFILGMFMDSAGIIMVMTPILLPFAVQLGFHPVWSGIFLMLSVQFGNITPPVGVTLFAVQSISGDSIKEIARGCLPYWLSFLFSVIVLILFPSLATLLNF